MRTLVEYLKNARIENDYSQEYIAVCLGISSSTISRWENGHVSMTLDQLEAYAKLVGVTRSSLASVLAGDGNASSVPPPIAEIELSVYTEAAYSKIVSVLYQLGIKEVSLKITRTK